MQKIAVQKGLTPVQEVLSGHGYDVELVDFDAFSKVHAEDYDAIIVTGMNNDFMGMQDTATGAPVIDATGMTPEDIYEQLQRSFL